MEKIQEKTVIVIQARMYVGFNVEMPEIISGSSTRPISEARIARNRT